MKSIEEIKESNNMASGSSKGRTLKRKPPPTKRIMRVRIDFAIIANKPFHMPDPVPVHELIISAALFVCQRVLKRNIKLLRFGTVKYEMCSKVPQGMKLPEGEKL